MTAYLVRRLLQALPQLLLISLILFVLLQAIGDPLAVRGLTRGAHVRPEDAARLRRQYGLDKPVLVQYLVWLAGNDWMRVDTDGDGRDDAYGAAKGVLRGDLGKSIVDNRPALAVITERLPNTLLLLVTAEVIIWILALVIGVTTALKQYSVYDHVLTAGSFIGYSMPVFWLALMLMYIFAVNFRRWGLPHLPTIGMCDANLSCTPADVARHMVLPLTVLVVMGVAEYSRYIRASMLEVLGENYIQFARAKGLHERRVITGHALKNGLLPFVTLAGMELPFLLAGAAVTEAIFGWPGTGRLFVERLERADFPVLMAMLMLIAVAVVIFQLLTDLVYAFLDPRIHVAE